MIWFKMNEFGLDSDKIYKYTSSGGKQKNRKKKINVIKNPDRF